MGLFDIFKKKPSDNGVNKQNTDANNAYLLESLISRLTKAGYKAEKHPQYLSLTVNGEVEIAFVIIDNPNNHPAILHLMVLTIHPKHFAGGIEENVVGLGTTIEEKVGSVLDNYINTTFLPIMDSFSDSHDAELDFMATANGKEILWHPKPGLLTLQGRWGEQPEGEPFLALLQDKVKNKLTDNKLNWLKVYVSKQADGTVIGECLFNNEPWEEGLHDITRYALAWKPSSDFRGMKQFIMFRRCDAYDAS